MPVTQPLPDGPYTVGAGTPGQDAADLVAFLTQKGSGTDAEDRARANHTGTQATATVTGLDASLTSKLDSTTASSTYATVVEHNATAATARPAGAVRVFWRGTVTPSNSIVGDRYVNITTPAAPVESICTGIGPVVFVPLGGSGLPGGYFSAKTYGAVGDGTTNDAAALQSAIDAALAAGGGVVYLPPGVYMVGTPLTLQTGVSIAGAAMTLSTLKATATLAAPILRKVLPAGTSLRDLRISDLTIDGNTGPTGTITGLFIDSTASTTTSFVTQLLVERVQFKNCERGIDWASNNAYIRNQRHDFRVTKCRFEFCKVGVLLGGTYGFALTNSYLYRCTLAGVASSGFATGRVTAPTNGGLGYNTLTTLHDLHFEGPMENESNTEDSGILLQSSSAQLSSLKIIFMSHYSMWYQDGEGQGSTITGVSVYGVNGAPGTSSAVRLSGLSVTNTATAQAMCTFTNFNIDAAGGPSSGGYFNAAIGIDGGSWRITDGSIADNFKPDYIFFLDFLMAGNGSTGKVFIDGVHGQAFNLGYIGTTGSPTNRYIKISNSVGYNPDASVAVVVPATGLSVPVTFNDRNFYVLANSVGTTASIGGSPAIGIPNGTVVQLTVPGSKTFAPTYTGLAPSWVVYSR